MKLINVTTTDTRLNFSDLFRFPNGAPPPFPGDNGILAIRQTIPNQNRLQLTIAFNAHPQFINSFLVERLSRLIWIRHESISRKRQITAISLRAANQLIGTG